MVDYLWCSCEMIDWHLIERVDIRLHRTVFVVQNAEVSPVVSSQSRVSPRCVADDPAIISSLHPRSHLTVIILILHSKRVKYSDNLALKPPRRVVELAKTLAHGPLSPTMRVILQLAQAVFPRRTAAIVTVVFFANCDISVFSHQIAPPFFFNLFVSQIIGLQVMLVLFGYLNLA